MRVCFREFQILLLLAQTINRLVMAEDDQETRKDLIIMSESDAIAIELLVAFLAVLIAFLLGLVFSEWCFHRNAVFPLQRRLKALQAECKKRQLANPDGACATVENGKEVVPKEGGEKVAGENLKC
uniref:Uncharacterized protein n=2 Tax=Caenorhabditis japonica TaxID=281687 RepID=A0A8R1ISH6_CAEJA